MAIGWARRGTDGYTAAPLRAGWALERQGTAPSESLEFLKIERGVELAVRVLERRSVLCEISDLSRGTQRCSPRVWTPGAGSTDDCEHPDWWRAEAERGNAR